MSRPRFVVQTVTGYNSASGRAVEGVSAHVCDSAYLFRVVATYRSEDRVGNAVNCQRVGKPETLRRAHEHAERLNRDTA